nr:hypothetical protein [Flavobacterium covae]
MLIQMSSEERISYFQKFIKELKKKDSLKVALDKKKAGYRTKSPTE